jgi:hypothetical protein
MGSQPTLDPAPTTPPDTGHHDPDGRVELLEHLQTPAAFGGHEFGDGPSTRSPMASAVTWTPATATITPA